METTSKEARPSKIQRSLKGYIGITLRGMCMGASDIVPGVSGGTMAFILGIYEELINSIKTLGDADFLGAVARFRIKDIFQILNWEFLLALAAGILLAVVTMAGILENLLINQPVFVWSFFFGLVLASVFVVSKRVKQWNVTAVILLLVAILGSYIVVGLVPLQTPNVWWFWVLSGALASCALILPGISGAFILVLLGKYQDTLSAVNGLRSGDLSQIWTIIFLAAGAAIGLILFSRVLSWLFKNHHDYTVAILIGLMIGSLRKIWPWKQDLEYLKDAAGQFVLDSEGLRVVTKQINILPDMSTSDGVTQVVIAVVLMLIGIAAVITLDRVANKKEEEAESDAAIEAH